MTHPTRRRFLTTAMGAAALPLAGKSATLPLAEKVAAQEPETSKPAAGTKTQFALNLEMWLGGMPFADRIHEAADLGFKWIEFWPWRGKNLDEIKAACAETEIRVAQFTAWGFSPGMNVLSNHDRLEKEILESCKVANDIGAPMMTVVGGNDQKGMSQKEMHENIIVGLKRVAPIAEAHNVMLILEPMNIRVDHKGHCLYGSPDAVRICREVNSPKVKINWDLYHMQISEGDLCGRLKDGFDQVGYLQLADHPGRREPGTGEIHYNRVLKQAWDLGYRGPVGVECYPSEAPEKSAARLAAADVW
jgi:hydroxypyruvate isomerase